METDRHSCGAPGQAPAMPRGKRGSSHGRVGAATSLPAIGGPGRQKQNSDATGTGPAATRQRSHTQRGSATRHGHHLGQGRESVSQSLPNLAKAATGSVCALAPAPVCVPRSRPPSGCSSRDNACMHARRFLHRVCTACACQCTRGERDDKKSGKQPATQRGIGSSR